ncbi:Bug family tripartite tricarboxylate transporter substrate binding protein [Rhabdaerophilum calidifontis]|uniref:Bug family tripartite tricarboxylate transporter substrate binding protein n=1 Tax=Rhabdaerophilum calidifontis TaxID=2604328 RepID=UPI001FE4392F|nr:tripartite tricarboxylate transporter substrate-binding protein [Rhabdaerophilum calidifontis]
MIRSRISATLSSAMLSLAAAALAAGTAAAQPAKTECLAGAKPGGGFDLTCRLAGAALHATKLIKDPMAVSYMEGGVGAVAYNHVVGTRPGDSGLVVAASSGSALLIAQGKFGKHDENAVRWVGALGADFGVIAVAPDSPIKTLKDLVAAYGKDPGAFPIGGGGAVGSQDWMKMALLAKEAKADPKKMRYAALEGGGAVTTALQGGHIKIAAGDASEMIALHEQGKLRILAVMSERRLPGRFKDIPTTFEQGYTIDWPIWRGLYVGPKVSDADYNWWVDTLKKLKDSPEFIKEREARGLFAFDSIGADFEKRVKTDVARFKQLAKEAGL